MNISRSQRTYIITQAIIGLFINVVLNAAVGYYSFDMTAMLSVKSLSFDFFMTNFMLLFMTSMILSRATQKEITEKNLLQYTHKAWWLFLVNIRQDNS